MPTPTWSSVAPALARQLADARRQAHHAAQFATALGISFLPPSADDSHTTLEWREADRALVSQPVHSPSGEVRLAVRIPDLVLMLLRDEHTRHTFDLRGQTTGAATTWVRTKLNEAGLTGPSYSLDRHFEIRAHPVGSGAPYSADAQHLEQLAGWFGNAAQVLDAVRGDLDGSPVRCWPHHFDIATLLTVRDSASVGVGMEPGDGYYDEPYFYVNASPQPSREALTASLEGGGQWHTHEWIGAVLPASRVSGRADEQEQQVRSFLHSAVKACRLLVS